jgi:hypothetical protein
MGGEFIEESNVQEEESDLFEDVDSDNDEEDSDNDNAMEEKGKKKKTKTKTSMKARQSELKKESQKKFFKDL